MRPRRLIFGRRTGHCLRPGQVLLLEQVLPTLVTLTPRGIRTHLGLNKPIYEATAAYGHFGRSDKDFTWERTDRADDLRRLCSA